MVRIVGKNFIFYNPPRCRSEECEDKIDRESIIRKRKARNVSESSVIKIRKLWSDDTESEISTSREIDDELNSSVFQSDDDFQEDSDHSVVIKVYIIVIII